jgi:alcohol dehydrogenase (cytochrome c)
VSRIVQFVIVIASALMLAGDAGRAQSNARALVTDEMLLHPDPGDWIHWRRTLDGWGFSPLDEINRGNVGRLQRVWSRTVTPGLSEAVPLVYQGLMYIAKPMTDTGVGGVQAVDAATGSLIWEYRKELDTKPLLAGRMRSLAIYGDKLFLATPDAHIVALNAWTGKAEWERVVADHKLGYRYTSGPIVVAGKVVAGMAGCDRYKNDVCFISAHDAETGRELWRTATIARPGEPGGDTWGDLPLMFRAGGDAWIPGSYDADTNLIYWSTAQAKPWARLSRGTDGDALYTNSVLALDPASGKIVWYRQLIPGETHDMDEVFENVLIDRENRRSLFKIGKLGILWELDRSTGAFLSAHDLGYQNVLDLDPRTGAVTYRPEKIPVSGVPLDICPDLDGLHTWRAMAYHPATEALYVPVTLRCETTRFTEVERVDGGAGATVPPYAGAETLRYFPHPKYPDARGGLIALDIKTGRAIWQHVGRQRPASAALTTAGGLVIMVDDSDPTVRVFDAATGEVLFESRLAAAGAGFPIAYAVRGKQYIAIPSGDTAPGVTVFSLPDAASTLLTSSAPRSGAPRAPEALYQEFCSTCHDSGWQGAPRRRIDADWERRRVAGVETLLGNTQRGLGAMPAKGTCGDCTDDELRRLVEWLASAR